MILSFFLIAGSFVGAASARDIDLKVHDMKSALPAGTTVEVVLGEPGATGSTYTCRDDGAAPDAIAGDHLYTTHVDGLALDHGSVVVKAAGKTWEGGFRFDDTSDPVLLVGLEENGFAAASSREVMFVPQDRMAPPPTPGTTAPGGAPNGAEPGTGAPPTGAPPDGAMGGGSIGGGAMSGGAGASGARTSTGMPAGMWLGWIVAVAAVGGIAVVARARPAAAPRIPPVVGGTAPRQTSAARGPYASPDPTSDRLDLWLGPGPGARIGEGTWTPIEIALATTRMAGPVRVVVTDPSRLVGGDFGALAGVLSGVADLLWVEGGGEAG